MATQRFVVGWAWEDSGLSMMARIYGAANTAITQATISTIVIAIYECETEAAAEAGTGTVVSGQGGSQTVSAVVYDTLQTDARWTIDSTGYNFRYDSVAADRPNGGKWYRYEIKFTPSSGAAFHVVGIIDTPALIGS